jgi:hypothetical protein
LCAEAARNLIVSEERETDAAADAALDLDVDLDRALALLVHGRTRNARRGTGRFVRDRA